MEACPNYKSKHIISYSLSNKWIDCFLRMIYINRFYIWDRCKHNATICDSHYYVCQNQLFFEWVNEYIHMTILDVFRFIGHFHKFLETHEYLTYKTNFPKDYIPNLRISNSSSLTWMGGPLKHRKNRFTTLNWFYFFHKFLLV